MSQVVLSPTIEEIPITKDSISGTVPWVVGLLVFLLCLVLSGASAIGVSMYKWQIGMGHKISVEIPLQHEIDRDRITSGVSDYLRAFPGVTSVDAQNKESLQGIFGVSESTMDPQMDIPLPVMIEVGFDPAQPANIKEIIAQLQNFTPGVRVEAYTQWHDMVSILQRSTQLIAYAFIMLIALTVITVVTLVTRAGLISHRENITILQLIGASNSYVAKKFQNHALLLSVRGASIGFILALPVIWLLNMGMVYLGVPDLIKPQFDLSLLGILAVVPLFVVLLSVCVSRFAVLRALS